MPSSQPLTIFLCGDVMTGRGIDQILAQPSTPILYESYVQDARDYVLLAEMRNGQIPRGVHGDYLWGDGLNELKQRQPRLKLINLETSITKSNDPWPHKGINYRMHPANIDALLAANIDVCGLANNHVLDWGMQGFIDTMSTLQQAHICYAGAGMLLQQAQSPAIITLPSFAGRILIFAMGVCSSGIPSEWGATEKQPGVWLLANLSPNTVKEIKNIIARYRQSQDLCLVSIHWGGNWGYPIPAQHQRFAHTLIDEAGVNVVHGHSSHHPMGIEVYNHSPIFYGCGDLINDYEGINGYEQFREELCLMYFLTFDDHLQLKQLELVPFERKKFTLHYAQATDSQWLANTLQYHSQSLCTSFALDAGVIHCVW